MVVLSSGPDPDPEGVKNLFKEYNMTPEIVRRDVAHIRQWMVKQPHLPRIPASKEEEINYWIEGFLRLTKNNVEKTKTAVDCYFKAKHIFGEIFSIKDFQAYLYSNVFDNLFMMLLPKLTPDGLRIMLYGVRSENAALFQPMDFFRRMGMVLDIQQKAGIDFTGIHVVIYARYGTLGHLAQFDLTMLKKVFKLAKKAYPIRLKHTHIIYPPTFVEAAVKIIKPFLTKKVMSRLSVHKDLQSLWQTLPKEVLPADLGGELQTLQEMHEMWRDRILDHYDWFQTNRNLVSDESKRCRKDGKNDKYGQNGTFRKLTLD
ncbi:alpha-tocopherol transfer protein-like [Planococcus citri]|uniref:alpha-tocopherol transfer protein-like n=1 Tax=Planococcus citri TaxID=170843 RepID=UPI0031F98616